MRFGNRREYLQLAVATSVVPLLFGGALFALWRWRAPLEPLVKLVDWFVMARRHGPYSYDPDRYWLYGAILVCAGLMIPMLGLWALLDKPVSDRRLQAYLNRHVSAQDREHHRSL